MKLNLHTLNFVATQLVLIYYDFQWILINFFPLLIFWLYRFEKEWEKLQIKVGELLEARPQEGTNNPT